MRAVGLHYVGAVARQNRGIIPGEGTAAGIERIGQYEAYELTTASPSQGSSPSPALDGSPPGPGRADVACVALDVDGATTGLGLDRFAGLSHSASQRFVVSACLVGIVGSIWIVGALLSYLAFAHGRLAGHVDQERRGQLLSSLADEHQSERPLALVERLLIGSVFLAAIASAPWFFFAAGNPLWA